MLVRLIIETMHLDARGSHYEQVKTGALVRGHLRRSKLETLGLRTVSQGSSCWFMMDLVTGWLKELLMVFQGKQEQ